MVRLMAGFFYENLAVSLYFLAVVKTFYKLATDSSIFSSINSG
jgi:hypothetical protein